MGARVTTKFDPFEHGVYRRFIDSGGYLNTIAWNRAAENGEHVGTCRMCGYYMLAEPTHQAGRMYWYGAYCTNHRCGRTIASPQAEVLRRSSRHGEMPEGYWAKRTQKGD